MKATPLFIAGLVVASAPFTSVVSAQMLGNPVYFSPTNPIGVTVAGDFGICASECGSPRAKFYGARATLGLPMIDLGVGLGSIDAGGASEIVYEAKASATVFGGPLIPVSVAIQAGVGRLSDSGVSILSIPIGVGFGFSIPNPGVSIKPWVAPRIHVTRVSGAGFSATETDFAVSAGVNIGMPGGLGFHAALDVLKGDGGSLSTFGIGIHYTFKPPNAPLVPGI